MFEYNIVGFAFNVPWRGKPLIEKDDFRTACVKSTTERTARAGSDRKLQIAQALGQLGVLAIVDRHGDERRAPAGETPPPAPASIGRGWSVRLPQAPNERASSSKSGLSKARSRMPAVEVVFLLPLDQAVFAVHPDHDDDVDLAPDRRLQVLHVHQQAARRRRSPARAGRDRRTWRRWRPAKGEAHGAEAVGDQAGVRLHRTGNSARPTSCGRRRRTAGCPAGPMNVADRRTGSSAASSESPCRRILDARSSMMRLAQLLRARRCRTAAGRSSNALVDFLVDLPQGIGDVGHDLDRGTG